MDAEWQLGFASTRRPRELSLFTGYGGMSLGLRLLMPEIQSVGYVEIDPYCQEIIKARIRDGFLDDAPIWPDIRAFDGRQCRGLVDIVTAGFPCQPWSVAGKRRGVEDERNLWPDTIRVIREVEPSFVLLENVPKLKTELYWETVLGDLAESGYGCVWDCIPASAIGAPHQRDRLWVLAYSRHAKQPGRDKDAEGSAWPARSQSVSRGSDIPDADKPGLEEWESIAGNNGKELKAAERSSEYVPNAGRKRYDSTQPESISRGVGPASPGGVCADVPGSGQLNGHLGGPGAGPLLGERREEAGISGGDVEDAGCVSSWRGAIFRETEGSRPLGESPRPGWWNVKSPLGGVADESAYWVDRLG